MKINKIFILTISAMLTTAFFSLGYNHFDEHFQILEFANYKLGLTPIDSLPWEFREKMRPTLQSFIAYSLHQILPLNPFSMATLLRLISALLTIVTSFLFLKAIRKTVKLEQSIESSWIFLSFLAWFIVLQGVRYSSENWSGQFFVLGITLIYPHINLEKQGKKFSPIHLFLLSGICLGISFGLRFQVGFMILGLSLWSLFIGKVSVRNIFILFIGFVFSCCFNAIIDKWFYGDWVVPAYNYLVENLIKGKVNSFGVEPWWFYLNKIFIKAIPPIGLTIILLTIAIIVFRAKSLLTWIIFPFLAIHFAIGHKETRFLFPLIPLFPLFFIESYFLIKKIKPRRQLIDGGAIAKKTIIICNWVGLLVISFKPVDNYINLYQKIYESFPETTILYTYKENPYRRILDIYYYKRSSLKIREFDENSMINSCPNHERCLLLLSSINSDEKIMRLIENNKMRWIPVHQDYQFLPEDIRKKLKRYTLYQL